MSKICKDCKGRGSWMESTNNTDNNFECVWHECGTCKGTGLSQDPDDGDDFDIGGESYADED